MNLLGIIHVYNESDCISTSIKSLLYADHDVHVFDHGSTDDTADVIKQYPVGYHEIDRSKYIWCRNMPKYSPDVDMYVYISKFINSLNGYDWVTWLDADEVLVTQDYRLPDKHAYEQLAASGCQLVMPRLCQLLLTEKSLHTSKQDYLKNVRHWLWRKPGGPATPRSWQWDKTGILKGRGRHRGIDQWNVQRRNVNTNWILYNYLWRSEEQGREKFWRRGGQDYAASKEEVKPEHFLTPMNLVSYLDDRMFAPIQTLLDYEV